jgi:hypothetical protein
MCVSAASEDAQTLFSGTCDVPCTAESDCAPLGTGFACRSGACRAEPEARQSALSSGRSRAALMQSVETETCETGMRWVGSDTPSAEMRPGSGCVGCHEETGARPLLIGGTVYPTWGGVQAPLPLDGCYGLEGIEVVVTDFEGRERSTVTNRAGNFYFEGEESELPMPYAATLRWSQSDVQVATRMFTMPTYGGCARCHALPAGDVAVDFQLGADDPEYVVPAGVIFTPGLTP